MTITAKDGAGASFSFNSRTEAGGGLSLAVYTEPPTMGGTSVTSADTSKHAMSAQAVKTPVILQMNPAAIGTCTIGTASTNIFVLSPGQAFEVYPANVSEINYTFSIGTGGVEKLFASWGQ